MPRPRIPANAAPVLDLRALPPDGPGENRPPTPLALRRAAQSLEDAVGGREALVTALLPHASSDDQLRLVGVLADPLSDRHDLGALLQIERVPLSTLVGMLRDAKLAAAHVEALSHVAEALPAVARSVMARAVPSKTVCPDCDGLRTFTADPSVDDPNPSPIACPTCAGRGLIFRDTTLAEQKLALELGRLLTKAPGVAVSVNQHNQTAMVTTGGVSYDDLTRVTDRLLYPDARRRRPSAPAQTMPPDLDVPRKESL